MKIRIKNIYSHLLHQPRANILFLFILVTILISITGAAYFFYKKDQIEKERFVYLRSISDYKISQIENWLKEKHANLEIVKACSPFINITDSRAGITQDVKNWLSLVKKYSDYENIVFTNAGAKIIFSILPLKPALTKSDSLLIESAADSNSIRFSDSEEKTAGDEFLRFYVPFKKTSALDKNPLVLILELNPQKYFDAILNYSLDKSPTLEALLVKAVGDSVVYLNKLRYSNRRKEFKYDVSNKALRETAAIKDMPGFVKATDYKDDNVIAYIQKVPSSAWFLITKINNTEFYEPVNNLARLIFLAAVSADLFFAVILFFIWRKNIVDNYKKMYSAQQEKTKVENRFDTLVNGVLDVAIFILDSEGNVLSWNKGAVKIYGYTAEEIIGKHFSVFFTEEERKNHIPYLELQKTLANNGNSEEGWRLRKDGSTYWANAVISGLKDDSGNVYGFLNVTRDLTEKRNIEEEIKNSRDFYLKLLDDFPNPVWRSDSAAKFNYFNKAWLKFTGRMYDEELGDGWISGIHPEDTQVVVENYAQAFRNKENFTVEYRLKNSLGEYRWVVDFGLPYYDMENNFAGYIGSLYDIDDRKKYDDTIQTLMRISEKLYSSLEINQILDSLVTECTQLTGAEGGFASIKDEKENYQAKKYFRIDHWEYIDLELAPEHNVIRKFISTKASQLLTEVEYGKNIDAEFARKYKVKHVLSTPLFGSDDELLGFFEIHNKKNGKVFTKEDINLLRSVARNASISISKSLNYEKLRQAEIQLRKSESELRNLTAQIQYAREAERQNIAREVHDELGQLFTGINLNISLLTESLEQKKHLSIDEILDELHSVQAFVNKGIQTVRDISGSLRSYVLDHLGLIPAIQEYSREIERISGVKCEFNSGIDSFDLGEEKNVALFRVVQEALTNIIRHAEATLMKVDILNIQSKIKIEISDNGKGIPKGSEYFAHSMGLLGMKERVMFIGGKLEFESEEGNGTRIIISIPMNG